MVGSDHDLDLDFAWWNRQDQNDKPLSQITEPPIRITHLPLWQRVLGKLARLGRCWRRDKGFPRY